MSRFTDLPWPQPNVYPFGWCLQREMAHLVLHGMKPHQFIHTGRWLLHHPQFLVIDRGSTVEVQITAGRPAEAWPEREWAEVPIDILKALVWYACERLPLHHR